MATTAQDQTGTTPLNEDVFMLPIDPGDGPGSVTPAQPLHDIVPFQAMAYGGTIIRPGAVAGGGTRNARDGGHVSCEVIERALATVARDPGELPWLMTELAASRLWVPLPDTRPFTDGSVVQLPLISYQGGDFVPSGDHRSSTRRRFGSPCDIKEQAMSSA